VTNNAGVIKWSDPDLDGIATATYGSSGGTTVTGESDVPGLVADMALKAPLASPTFTGTPSLPTGTTGVTQSAGDSSTKLATTAFVTTADNLKANLASPTFTGTPSLPTGTTGVTQSAADGSTKLATTLYVDTADALKAPKASPTFTGTVTVPNGVGATDAAAFGQIPTAGTVGGLPKIVVRTANSGTISSNAVLANDDTLLWAVGASDRWFFQALLTFTAADSSGLATTADVQVGFSVPTGGAMQWGPIGATGNTFGGYGATATANSPLGVQTAASALATGGAAVSWGLALCGFYTGDGSHTGSVTLQWAQATSNAATLLIAKNSSLILWRIA
jgi:hypothetical protein